MVLVADTVVLIRPRASSAPSRLGRIAMEIRPVKLERTSATAEQLTELHERLSELLRQLPAGFTVKQAAALRTAARSFWPGDASTDIRDTSHGGVVGQRRGATDRPLDAPGLLASG